MTNDNHARRFYWEERTNSAGEWREPPGEDLAALRSGTGREPGSVPSMWPFYASLKPHGLLTEELRAEHLSLTLYAVHQQSQRLPMHRAGVKFGTAVLALKQHDDSRSAAAVDRRFAAAATATSFAEISMHLRGLVTQLKGLPRPQPLDYTRLFFELTDWQDPERAMTVRRRWGAAYFVRTEVNATDANPATSETL